MHDYFKNTPQYHLETAENAALLPKDGFFTWLFHSPHKYALPESARYLYPDRSGDDLVTVYKTLLSAGKKDMSKKEKAEKIYAITGCLIRVKVNNNYYADSKNYKTSQVSHYIFTGGT